MTSVEDIEKAIEKLDPGEFERLRSWFDEFQAARFDAAIDRDVRAGRLDHAAEQALADHRQGRTREL